MSFSYQSTTKFNYTLTTIESSPVFFSKISKSTGKASKAPTAWLKALFCSKLRGETEKLPPEI